MTVSMTELMRSVRNHFVTGAVDGAWRVEGGLLSGEPMPRPGWIALEGLGAFELAEDGRTTLPDGPIEGRIWLLSPSPDFLRLLEEINDWLTRQGSAALGGVTRRKESFGVYSAETAYGSGGSGGWETAFAGRMAPYRRMFAEVNL